MNILFINANLHGHINPTLELVKKLAERGNHIHYFCSDTFSEQVTKAGGNHIGFSSKLDMFFKSYKPTDRHPFFMLMEYVLLYDEILLPEILSLLEKKSYGLIICDSIFGGACFLEQITEIPIVCSHSSFAMSKSPMPHHMLVADSHPQLDHCYQILYRICQTHGMNEPTLEQVFISKGDLNIVYTTHNFNGDPKVNAPEYLFAGPSMNRLQDGEHIDFSVVGNRTPIYISLGSLNTKYLAFYKTCISALRDTDYYVFMSIGKKCDASQLGDMPLNFCVKDFLPQLNILKHSKAFITHAGFNSVNEALYYGVPMLALPLVNDQHMVAKRITSMQLGITGNMKEVSSDQLRDTLKTLLTDKVINQNVMRISQEMQNGHNHDIIAEKIEAYAERKKASTCP
ncbi:hypothetical protein HZI73_24845 [Vallitalea pronyensis]|uniref:Uncharacterized protein n=1 Tax=Vallitalea pronyensis TaxID=1348613 RepID=A0A8J8MPN3_9FIRM|nr:macrolide family glycosyltransferase [Vallitalea pronyensis]QUI25329.1 hypothetical protein HZI73_24845 [Vallitalea pronyensis]